MAAISACCSGGSPSYTCARSMLQSAQALCGPELNSDLGMKGDRQSFEVIGRACLPQKRLLGHNRLLVVLHEARHLKADNAQHALSSIHKISAGAGVVCEQMDPLQPGRINTAIHRLQCSSI